jgi:hypothetical protein
VAANKKPKEGTGEWEKSLRDNPAFVKETIRSLTARAVAGEPGAAEQLARWVADFPEHRPAVAALQSLAEKAEVAWAKAAALGDPLAERAARDEAAALRAELLPPGAGVLERVLADTLVVAWLAYSHTALLAAPKADHPAVQAARDRRLSVAQKRLMAALKGWQLVAGKTATGPQPRLKLFGTSQSGAA